MSKRLFVRSESRLLNSSICLEKLLSVGGWRRLEDGLEEWKAVGIITNSFSSFLNIKPIFTVKCYEFAYFCHKNTNLNRKENRLLLLLLYMWFIVVYDCTNVETNVCLRINVFYNLIKI